MDLNAKEINLAASAFEALKEMGFDFETQWGISAEDVENLTERFEDNMTFRPAAEPEPALSEYEVTLVTATYSTVRVLAASPEAAAEIAEEKHGDDTQVVCVADSEGNVLWEG